MTEPSNQPVPPAETGVARPTRTRHRPQPGFALVRAGLPGLGTGDRRHDRPRSATLQRDLVERRQWMTRADFVDGGPPLGQTMPGPARRPGRPCGRLLAPRPVRRAGRRPPRASCRVPAGPHRRGNLHPLTPLPDSAIAVYGIAPVWSPSSAWGRRLEKLARHQQKRPAAVGNSIILLAAHHRDQRRRESAVPVHRLWPALLVVGRAPCMPRLRPQRHPAPAPPHRCPRRSPCPMRCDRGQPIWVIPGGPAAETPRAAGCFSPGRGVIFGKRPGDRAACARDGRPAPLASPQASSRAIAMGLMITPGPVGHHATFIGYWSAGLAGAMSPPWRSHPESPRRRIPGGVIRHRANKQVKAFLSGATAGPPPAPSPEPSHMPAKPSPTGKQPIGTSARILLLNGDQGALPRRPRRRRRHILHRRPLNSVVWRGIGASPADGRYQRMLHIGDSPREDHEGAASA